MGVRLTVRSRTLPEASSPWVYEFDQQRIVIGRGAGSDVRVPYPAMSHTHAIIEARGSGYIIKDEDSTNGTRIGGSRLPPGRPKPLSNGDRVELGGFVITFESAVAVGEPTTGDHTAALARQILQQAMAGEEEGERRPTILILNGPDEGRSLIIPPPPARLTIGRSQECDLSIQDGDASREHVEIASDLSGIIAKDLGGKNPLMVNERAVSERRLKDRDELLIGSTIMVFEDPTAAELRRVTEEPDKPLEETTSTPSEPPASDDTGTTPSAEDTNPTTPDAWGPEHGLGPAPRRKSPSTSFFGTDAVIYGLALVVLALSIAGLYMLLRGG